MKRAAVLGAFPLLAFALLSQAQAKEIHFPDYHFTIAIPDEWAEIPSSELDTRALLPGAAALPGEAKVVAGFRPPSGESSTTVSVVLLHFPPMNLDFDELVIALAKSEREQLLPALHATETGKDVTLQGPFPIFEHASIVTSLENLDSPAGRLKVRQVTYPGSKGTVFLQVSARPSEFDSTPELFWGIQNSVRFDPGFEYSGKPPGSLFRQPGHSASFRRAAIRIGAALALLAAISVTLISRRRRRRSQT